jgi:hypothetical protein
MVPWTQRRTRYTIRIDGRLGATVLYAMLAAYLDSH